MWSKQDLGPGLAEHISEYWGKHTSILEGVFNLRELFCWTHVVQTCLAPLPDVSHQQVLAILCAMHEGINPANDPFPPLKLCRLVEIAISVICVEEEWTPLCWLLRPAWPQLIPGLAIAAIGSAKCIALLDLWVPVVGNARWMAPVNLQVPAG